MNDLEAAFWSMCRSIAGKKEVEPSGWEGEAIKRKALKQWYPSIMKRWLNKISRPSASHVFEFYENVYQRANLDRSRSSAVKPDAKVCILLPVKDVLPVETVICLLKIAEDLKEKVAFLYHYGHSDISTSRNRLVKAFKESNAEWSLWIDSDMILPVGRAELYKKLCQTDNVNNVIAGAHIVERLISHDKPIVSGVYYQKRLAGRAVISQDLLNKTVPQEVQRQSGELIETDFCGAGCLLVHRSVYEAMEKAYPDQKCPHADMPFQYFRNEKNGVSEDVFFCMKAKAMGLKVYVDTGCVCGHIGSYAYGPWSKTI